MIGLRLNGKQAFMATVAFVIMPTLWWDNLSVLSYVSMSGVLATTVTLGSISWIGAFDGIGFHQKGKLINWSGIPTALSLYAFCYGAHPVLPTLYSSMKSKHQFNNVSHFYLNQSLPLTNKSMTLFRLFFCHPKIN